MSYVITGIPVKPGAPIPIRPEITAFVNDETKKIQLSLFIRALTTFQNMDVTQMKSFFQVAGTSFTTFYTEES
jgi:tyrosinase